ERDVQERGRPQPFFHLFFAAPAQQRDAAHRYADLPAGVIDLVEARVADDLDNDLLSQLDAAQIDRFGPPHYSIGTGLFLDDFAIVDGDPQRAVLQAIELHQERLWPVGFGQRDHQLPSAVGPAERPLAVVFIVIKPGISDTWNRLIAQGDVQEGSGPKSPETEE